MRQQQTSRGGAPKARRTQWPRGTWMRVISGERLRRRMNEKGYSCATLARDVSVFRKCSKSMIGHLVSGERATCTPELAEAIARRLDVDVDMLFVPSVSLDRGQVSKQHGKKAA